MAVLSAFSDEEIMTYLKQQVPDGTVSDDPEILRRQSFSTETVLRDSDLARAFVSAKSVADIQGVLKTARRFHIPVVPQTAFTNTVISADGITGAIILSLLQMDKILEIDSDDLLAVVQPGVINNDLDQAARKQGLFYAPDPGSKPISSIGGNAATNAGGMSTVRFGATKDNILGLKVILADGRIVKLGGTISGEHAVGMLKNQWNNVELGENVDELQHQIKSLLDPMGILNPKRKID